MFRRRFTSAVLAGIGLMQLNHVAHAQCAFDGPTKARGLKTSMVRAYASCPGITFAAPNTSTMAGVPGCAAPLPLSAYEFDEEKSDCSLSMKHKVESPCYDGSGEDCSAITVVAKCSGILVPGGATLAEDPGWNLGLLHRATINDATNGDQTIIDFPLLFPFATASAGKLSVKFELGLGLCGPLCPIFGPGWALPRCTQIEIINASIHDPSGAVFAVMGSASR